MVSFIPVAADVVSRIVYLDRGTAAGMPLHATLARRRLGELEGGAAGARATAEADAWLAARDVRAPERLARSFMPAAP